MLIVQFVRGFRSIFTKETRAQRRGIRTLVRKKTLSIIAQVVARQDFPKRRGGSTTADLDKKLDLGEAVVTCATPVRMTPKIPGLPDFGEVLNSLWKTEHCPLGLIKKTFGKIENAIDTYSFRKEWYIRNAHDLWLHDGEGRRRCSPRYRPS